MAFAVAGNADQGFMGRFSVQRSNPFLDFAGVDSRSGMRVVAVGRGGSSPPCGNGSPVDIRSAPAESLPFADAKFDAALAQLVVHFNTYRRPDELPPDVRRPVGAPKRSESGRPVMTSGPSTRVPATGCRPPAGHAHRTERSRWRRPPGRPGGRPAASPDRGSKATSSGSEGLTPTDSWLVGHAPSGTCGRRRTKSRPVGHGRTMQRAPDVSGPWTSGQLRRRGVGEQELRGPGYARVFHGVYAAADVAPTLRMRAEAALLVAPAGAALARHTAARLWGGVVPPTPEIHLTPRPVSRLRVSGIDARVRAGSATTHHHGLLMTTPAQAFVDLGTELGLIDLVILGDSMVRAGAVTPEELLRAAGTAPGRRAARRGAELVRARVDSPMETRLRLLLVLAGLPEPVVDVAIRDEGGRVVYRLDLGYPQVRVAVEYDGRQHAENTAQWRWDVRRREELESDGWRLVVVLAGDIYREPARTLARVVAALGERGMRVGVRGTQWQRYFPG